MIEIATIGAGGGSIARVDAGGLLEIGPDSAGSDPGPVAYGRGNDRPTVTDANLVLGRIDATNPIGEGFGPLDVEAARQAIDAHVGRPLGLGTLDAAEAVVRVANARMAGAIRLVSIERGFDPKRFAFMPFGGGGGLHAGALIRDVGLARAVIPRYPGVTSAMGCVVADMRQDFVQTVNALVSALDSATLGSIMEDHVRTGLALLEASGGAFAARETVFELDMAYVGQTHTVAVPIEIALENDRPVPPDRAAVQAAFDTAYTRTYGRLLPGGVARVINLRTAVIGRRPKFDLAVLAPGPEASKEAALRGSRPVYIAGDWREARVFARLALPVGAVIDGPAVLEQPDTTILIEPGLKGEVDRYGNLILSRREEADG